MLDVAALRTQVADRQPEGEAIPDLRVRNEHFTGGVDCVHDRCVARFECGFV